MNPLQSITGTIICGLILSIIFVFVVKAIGGSSSGSAALENPSATVAHVAVRSSENI